MTDMRIGDAERERTIEQLGRHVGAGRLDLAEFTERSDRATTARTRAELADVQADLPRLPDPQREARVRRTVLAATWGPWAFTAVVCLLVWAAVAVGGGSGYFWPIWVIGPWGAMLAAGTAVHAATGAPMFGCAGMRPGRIG
ncbi:DUF1707 SHOCT-like domain-containing protein [Pseudonocardia sp. HH130630-07]|uniref:DUF1707 SHOCT-like domain-containing protein n=1 Tax=Pseudonocardia sp. HH130630-07 TaxID=1690815 RepID=UPI000814FE52|nr:DUF1707 domain-containing protein [Pseudonocardia sp. HH130630-07]ANY06968.1 hypothetical protein AFB00_12455 [Pseudonocardia sp. HH130630-07]